MSQEDVVGPWSEDKLNLLRDYLRAYTKIMHKQDWCRGYHYVDAFAGTGKPRARDEERYIDGSPRVALSIAEPYQFHSYTFIEKDLRRAQQLQGLVEEFPDRRIYIYQGDCNELLKTRVVPNIRYDDFQRGLVFLDPFSMDLEWETLENIARAGSLEVFINIPIMALNRTALPNDPYTITEAQIERNARFWGIPDWRESFDIYEVVPGLFGPEMIKPHRGTGKRLGNLYKRRLQTVFRYVTDPLVMTNSKNAPLYALIFAGHNETGARIMRDIFSHFERLG